MTEAELKRIWTGDWLDRRCLYVLDSAFGPVLEHRFIEEINPLNFFAVQLWYLRATWRFYRLIKKESQHEK